MDINQIRENKLKFILQFSIPSIIAMMLQTVITVTDAYFVPNGHMNEIPLLRGAYSIQYMPKTGEYAEAERIWRK